VKKSSLVDERNVLILFAVTSAVFYATSTGMNDSNSGSHYALTKAIAEDQSFIIDKYVGYTGTIDAANVDGVWYSDRPPGTAFLASVFYFSGRVFSVVFHVPRFDAGWDAGNPGAYTVILLSVFSGAAAVVLFYLTLRRLGAGAGSSVVSALTLAFCTITWEYSQLLFSHALSLAVLLAVVYLAVDLKDWRRDEGKFIALCFLAGYSVLVEYPNILLAVPVAWYLASSGKVKVSKKLGTDTSFLKAAAAFIVPLVILAAYNTVNFGSPLSTSYTYNYHFKWARDATSTFTNPLFEGLRGLLIDSGKIDGGLLKTAPVILLALWSWPEFFRKRRREALLFSMLFLLHLLLYAKHQTYWGGGTRNTRYILTVTPFLLAPLYLWVEKYVVGVRGGILKKSGRIAFIILAYYSASYVTWDIIHFPGHEPFETAPVSSLSDLPYNVRVLFRNMRNLPFLTALLAASYSLISFRINRPLGFSRRKYSKFKDALVVLTVASILALMLDLSPGGGKSFLRFEASVAAGNWSRVELPVEAPGPGVLHVRGVVDVPQSGEMKGVLTAVECLSNLTINRMGTLSTVNCTGCAHCGGIDYDLSNSRYLHPGLNLMEFTVKSDRNIVSFDMK
jgi:hypothetical protein